MGIEIPEQYGGGGAKFFEAILAVVRVVARGRLRRVVVDVQNTLVNNALLRWGSERAEETLLARMAADTVGAYALSEANSGSDAFGLQTRAVVKGKRVRAEWPQAVDHQREGSRAICVVCHA